MSQVSAVPERMVDFQQLQVPDIAPLKREPWAANCAPGVQACGGLVEAVKSATTALHVFLTHMAQGITAYRNIVNDCTRTYADSAAYSEATIRAVCRYDPAKMLPDIAPILTAPSPAP